MRLKWKLILASLKMFIRQKEAILWTILFPLFMVFLFSFVKFDDIGTITIGVINNSTDTSLVHLLKDVKTLRVKEGGFHQELAALKRGDRVLVLVIPSEFNPTNHDSTTAIGWRHASTQSKSNPAKYDSVIAYLNAEKPQETQLGTLIIQRALDEHTFKNNGTISPPLLHTEAVNSRNLTYIDFLLPGILSMSIMQSGVFGVAFSFVSLKKRGILRRLLVTPINPNDFIIAQVATRLLILMVQVTIMVGAGVLFFDLHFVGNLLDMFVLGLIGGVIFLAMGFALAGLAKSEDQVAPLANVITLPMMLLSGVFFSRTNLPGFAHALTDFFPLTYLADGMRSIAIEGATLGGVVPQLAGLCVWAVITVFLAVKAFRWE